MEWRWVENWVPERSSTGQESNKRKCILPLTWFPGFPSANWSRSIKKWQSNTTPAAARSALRNLAMPPPPRSPAPRQSFPGALCCSGAPVGNGDNRAECCGPVLEGRRGLCKFLWDRTPRSRDEEEGGASGAQSSPDLQVSLQNFPQHSQSSPQTQNNCGDERPLAAGAGKLSVPHRQRHPGARRRWLPSPSDALHWVQNRSNSTASAGASSKSKRARKELSPVLGWPPLRRLRFAGRGLTAGWRKPSDKFFFFSSPDAGRASSPAAGGMRSP